MSLSSTTASIVGRGNGATTSFAYNFKIPSATEVLVTYVNTAGVATELTASQYSISGLGSDAGGTVTYPLSGSPIPSGSSITIARVLAVTQPTALANQGGYFPSVVEAAMDRIVMLIQQLAAGVGTARALLFPTSDVSPTQTLPAAAARANKYLAFDGSGNPLVLPGSSTNPDVSSNTAIATSSTTARSIGDRLGERANVRDFGALGNGVNNDAPAIQAAANTGRPVYFPAGIYKITTAITFSTIGQAFFGDAMELCVINLSGAIKGFVSSGVLVRANFRDLSITGDVTTLDAIDCSSGLLYESNWQNLNIYTGGRAIYAPSEFANTFQNIHFGSRNNHGIELKGDVCTTVIGCYAHRIDTNGKVGYRVYGGGTYIGCNGLDYGQKWGLFGSALAKGDAANIQFSPTFIGCNFEDFRVEGVRFRYNGNATFHMCTFVPPAAATSPTYDCSVYIEFTDQLIQFHQTGTNSKGATRNKLAEIFSDAGGAPLCYNSYATWDSNTTLTVIPNVTTSQSEFAVFGFHINKLNVDRLYGFYSPAITLWPVNSGTMSVAAIDRVKTTNTVPTTITAATGAVDGQVLIVHVRDANTTIKHLAGVTGQFRNKTGADIVATSGLPYMYISDGGAWAQI